MKAEREIIRDALAYVENKIHNINNFLNDAESTDTRISEKWKSESISKAKSEMIDAIKMFIWVIKRNDINIPDSFTDKAIKDMRITE